MWGGGMEAESLAHGSIRAAIHSIHTVSMARRHFFGRTQTLRDDSRSCQVLYAFSTYLFVHVVIDLSQELRLLSKYTDRLDVKLVVDLAMEIFIANVYTQTATRAKI